MKTSDIMKQFMLFRDNIKKYGMHLRNTLKDIDTCEKLLNNSYHFNLGYVEEKEAIVPEMKESSVKIPFPITLFSMEQEYNSMLLSVITMLINRKHLTEISDLEIKNQPNIHSDIFAMTFVSCGNIEKPMLMPSGIFCAVPLVASTVLKEKGVFADNYCTFPNFTKTLMLMGLTTDMILASSVNSARFFLNILSCKNIKIKESVERKMKKQLARKGAPRIKEFDIVIKVPGKGIIYKDKEIKEISFKEMDKYGMVGQKRGHFKTFTEERPLFGKHVGTWWWSPIFGTNHRNYTVNINN